MRTTTAPFRTPRSLALCSLLGLILAAGCAPPPPAGTPLAPGEIHELAASLTAATEPLQALRASGTGSAKVSGRRMAFSFALVYDAPDWVRADLRPEAGSLSGTMTALLLWSDQCGRVYFPGRSLDVRGCMSRADGPLAGIDLASAALGALDGSVLEELKDARVTRDGDIVVLTGDYRSAIVSTEFRGAPPRLHSVSLRDGQNLLTLTYRGHGWRPFGWFPKTVSARLETGGREAMTFDLDYSAARLTEHVDRGSYTFEVPPGARIVSWEDLGLWR